jgi:hypothetical protein
MARKAKGRVGHSMAADRELITLAKTKTLDEIVRRTGRTPESILKVGSAVERFD